MRKLAWCCGAYASAVFLGVLALPAGTAAWMALPALLLAAAGLGLRGNRRTRALLAGIFLAAGFLSCHAQWELRIRPAEALVGTRRTVCVQVTEYPLRFDADSSGVYVRLNEPGLPRARCYLSDYDAWLGALEPGDELRVPLSFVSARLRYGEETEISSARGVFLRAYVQGAPERLGRWRYGWLYFPQRLRRGVTELCARVFPADVAAFQTALLTGEKRALYARLPLYYALSRAGLMHVAAVSGMHVAFLAGFVRLLVPDRRRAAWLTAPLLLAFAALAGFTPSVARAVFMQLCLLGAPAAERESDAPTAFALSLAILLAVNPCAAASVSLQLSYSATAGILWLSPRLYERLMRRLCPERQKNRRRTRLAAAVCASVSCSLSALALTTPLTALHFGSISLIAPVTNVLCTWMISLLFVGGFLALGLGALLPTLGAALGWVLAWGDRYVFAVARLLAGLPCAALYTVNRFFVWWLVFAYLLFGAAWLLRDRERGMSLTRPAALAAVGLCACVLVTRLDWSGALRFTALDVGQGACALIECGERAAMVDCGGTGTLEYAGETAAYYTLSRTRRHLDALVLTHLHRDHANGVARLLALVEVDAIYLPQSPPEQEKELEAVLAAAEQSGTPVRLVTGSLLFPLGAAQLDIRALGTAREEEPGLFVRVSQGDFDALITGDAEALLERRYCKQACPPDIEVLLVGHHGAPGSTDEWVLRALAPELALISVGYNTYGHPHPETLDKLSRNGIEVHRTDEEGSLTVVNRSVE